jgi:hypothetical protein
MIVSGHENSLGRRRFRGKISALGFQVFPKHMQVELMEIDSLVMSWKTKLIREGSIR